MPPMRRTLGRVLLLAFDPHRRQHDGAGEYEPRDPEAHNERFALLASRCHSSACTQRADRVPRLRVNEGEYRSGAWWLRQARPRRDARAGAPPRRRDLHRDKDYFDSSGRGTAQTQGLRLFGGRGAGSPATCANREAGTPDIGRVAGTDREVIINLRASRDGGDRHPNVCIGAALD